MWEENTRPEPHAGVRGLLAKFDLVPLSANSCNVDRAWGFAIQREKTPTALWDLLSRAEVKEVLQRCNAILWRHVPANWNHRNSVSLQTVWFCYVCMMLLPLLPVLVSLVYSFWGVYERDTRGEAFVIGLGIMIGMLTHLTKQSTRYKATLDAALAEIQVYLDSEVTPRRPGLRWALGSYIERKSTTVHFVSITSPTPSAVFFNQQQPQQPQQPQPEQQQQQQQQQEEIVMLRQQLAALMGGSVRGLIAPSAPPPDPDALQIPVRGAGVGEDWPETTTPAGVAGTTAVYPLFPPASSLLQSWRQQGQGAYMRVSSVMEESAGGKE
jgi:hypothetical protein